MTLRTLVVYGNCHAVALAKLFSAVPELCREFEIFHVWDAAWATVPHDVLRRTTLLIPIVSPWKAPFPFLDELPKDCRQLSFPFLSFEPLWAQLAPDPRARQGSPDYGYGDLLAIRLSKMRLTREQVFEQYFETNLEDLLDLDRMLDIFFEKANFLDKSVDVPIYDYIKENFRSKRLFWAFNHPTHELLHVLGQRLLNAIGINSIPDEVVEAYVRNPPMGGLEVPIHPQVVDRFGLQWVTKNSLYHYQSGEQDLGNWSYQEFLWSYISRWSAV